MCKFYMFLLLLVFAGMIFAKAPVKQLTEREKLILKINRELEDVTVIKVLQKCNDDIRWSIEDIDPLSASKYYSVAVLLDNKFIKYRWFIADTGLSKRWLKKVYELLIYMSKTQRYLESAKLNGQAQTAKYKKAIEYFDLACKRFDKLIRNHVRVSAKVRQKCKLKKHMWQRAMREEI